MLQEQLSADLKLAMKAKDEVTVGVIRMVQAVIRNREIEKRARDPQGTLTDEEVLAVLRTETKKRKESITVFKQGGRDDLASKEEAELTILEKYLPVGLPRPEVEKIIGRILGTLSTREFGPVMREVMKELKGKADAQLISEVLKEKLSS